MIKNILFIFLLLICLISFASALDLGKQTEQLMNLDISRSTTEILNSVTYGMQGEIYLGVPKKVISTDEGELSVFVFNLGSEPEKVMTELINYFKDEGFKQVNEVVRGNAKGFELKNADTTLFLIRRDSILVEYKLSVTINQAKISESKPWVKYVIIAAVIVILVFLVYRFKDKIKNIFLKIKKPSFSKKISKPAARKQIASKISFWGKLKSISDKVSFFINLIPVIIFVIILILGLIKYSFPTNFSAILAVFLLIILPALALFFCAYNIFIGKRIKMCMIINGIFGILFILIGLFLSFFMSRIYRFGGGGRVYIDSFNVLLFGVFVFWGIALLYSAYRLWKNK
ncbi:hypothetical protein FJZ19_01475 [Candidatus Pacearchaeota archaeon]|nr:hypothetical protein [Candidatus Pacearchaeota archaeon]